jgi:hypothetical protein
MNKTRRNDMEKRNFVTSMRTSAESPGIDEMVSAASACFGGDQVKKEASVDNSREDLVKKSSMEDEKSDKEHFGLA